MSTEPESFLARWSRRKRSAERAREQPTESVAPQVAAAPPVTAATEATVRAEPVPPSAPAQDPAPKSELPPIESLDGLRSDYQAFFQQPVAENIRHAALKKLFSDPHFNQMDMLDVYVDDYTQFEPLPAAMKLRLASARDFLLDSERAELDAAEAPSESSPAVTDGAPSPVPEADAKSSIPAAAPVAPPPNEPEQFADIASLPAAPGKTTARDPSSN